MSLTRSRMYFFFASSSSFFFFSSALVFFSQLSFSRASALSCSSISSELPLLPVHLRWFGLTTRYRCHFSKLHHVALWIGLGQEHFGKRVLSTLRFIDHLHDGRFGVVFEFERFHFVLAVVVGLFNFVLRHELTHILTVAPTTKAIHDREYFKFFRFLEG